MGFALKIVWHFFGAGFICFAALSNDFLAITKSRAHDLTISSVESASTCGLEGRSQLPAGDTFDLLNALPAGGSLAGSPAPLRDSASTQQPCAAFAGTLQQTTQEVPTPKSTLLEKQTYSKKVAALVSQAKKCPDVAKTKVSNSTAVLCANWDFIHHRYNPIEMSITANQIKTQLATNDEKKSAVLKKHEDFFTLDPKHAINKKYRRHSLREDQTASAEAVGDLKVYPLSDGRFLTEWFDPTSDNEKEDSLLAAGVCGKADDPLIQSLLQIPKKSEVFSDLLTKDEKKVMTELHAAFKQTPTKCPPVLKKYYTAVIEPLARRLYEKKAYLGVSVKSMIRKTAADQKRVNQGYSRMCVYNKIQDKIFDILVMLRMKIPFSNNRMAETS